MATASREAELKQQGAVEAAQDPEIQVTPPDAEKSIVEESTKAGVQAFTLDPYASPEEKAAQARSVSTYPRLTATIFIMLTYMR